MNRQGPKTKQNKAKQSKEKENKNTELEFREPIFQAATDSLACSWLTGRRH